MKVQSAVENVGRALLPVLRKGEWAIEGTLFPTAIAAKQTIADNAAPNPWP